MLMIELRLSPLRARRWHLLLANALRHHGHHVSISWQKDQNSSVFAMDSLRILERKLYSAKPQGAGEKVGRVEFSPFPPCDAAVDLVLDCTGTAVAGAGPVLQPVFEKCLDHSALLEPLKAARPPLVGWRRLGDGAFVVSGRTAVSAPHILSVGYDDACARLVSLAERAVVLHERRMQDVPEVAVNLRQPMDTPGIAPFVTGAFARRVLDKLTKPLVRAPQWTVGWRRTPPCGGIVASGTCGAEAFSWLPLDRGRFVADPFPIVEAGKTHVFVEELPFATNKGIISVFEVDASGAPSVLRPVLERPYHLSYPNVFKVEGQIWMIPETCANRTIELYRPAPFPDRWELEAVLLDDIVAADVTVFQHDGLWWMTAATSDHGASSWDGLSLFYADRLTGPWTPHPLNPVVVDVRSARPGGWIVAGPDGLRRPAQDCTLGYGMGMAINRIDRLDKEHYAETVIARLSPSLSWQAHGFHTVNRIGDFEVIDALR